LAGEGSVYVGKEAEILIQPRALQNGADRFLRARHHEDAAFMFEALHRADQNRQA
jgi:hypothetical protein